MPPAHDSAGSAQIISYTSRRASPKYYQASQAPFCQQDKIALHLLRASVQGNFLAYPAIDRDPLLARIRTIPEFAAIRALAIERQKQIVEPWKAKFSRP